MTKFATRIILYIAILAIFTIVNPNTEFMLAGIVILGIVLALVNTIVRPLINILSIGFHILTLGVASVFVNILTLLIANGISQKVLDLNFLGLALLAIIIMTVDCWFIYVYYPHKLNKAISK